MITSFFGVILLSFLNLVQATSLTTSVPRWYALQSSVNAQYSTVYSDKLLLRPNNKFKQKVINLDQQNCYVESKEFTLTEHLSFGFFFEKDKDGKFGIKWYYNYSEFFDFNIFKVKFKHNNKLYDNVLKHSMNDGFFFSFFKNSWQEILSQDFEISINLYGKETVYSTVSCVGKENSNCTVIYFPSDEPCIGHGIFTETITQLPVATVTVDPVSTSDDVTFISGTDDNTISNPDTPSSEVHSTITTDFSSYSIITTDSQSATTQSGDVSTTSHVSYIYESFTVIHTSFDPIPSTDEYASTIVDYPTTTFDYYTETSESGVSTDFETLTSDYSTKTTGSLTSDSYTKFTDSGTTDSECSTSEYTQSFGSAISTDSNTRSFIPSTTSYSSTTTKKVTPSSPLNKPSTVTVTRSPADTTTPQYYPIELDCPNEVPYLYSANKNSNIGFYVNKIGKDYFRIDWFFSFVPNQFNPNDFLVEFRQNGLDWHDIFQTSWSQGFFYSWLADDWENFLIQVYDIKITNKRKSTVKYLSNDCSAVDGYCKQIDLPLIAPDNCVTSSSSDIIAPTPTGSFNYSISTVTSTVSGEVTSYTTYCPITTSSLSSLSSLSSSSSSSSSTQSSILTVITSTVSGDFTSYTTTCPTSTETSKTSSVILSTPIFNNSTVLSTELFTTINTITSCSNDECTKSTIQSSTSKEPSIQSSNPLEMTIQTSTAQKATSSKILPASSTILETLTSCSGGCIHSSKLPYDSNINPTFVSSTNEPTVTPIEPTPSSSIESFSIIPTIFSPTSSPIDSSTNPSFELSPTAVTSFTFESSLTTSFFTNSFNSSTISINNAVNLSNGGILLTFIMAISGMLLI